MIFQFNSFLNNQTTRASALNELQKNFKKNIPGLIKQKKYLEYSIPSAFQVFI